MFGYFRYHVSDDGLGFSPVECFAVFGVASTGAYDAADGVDDRALYVLDPDGNVFWSYLSPRGINRAPIKPQARP